MSLKCKCFLSSVPSVRYGCKTQYAILFREAFKKSVTFLLKWNCVVYITQNGSKSQKRSAVPPPPECKFLKKLWRLLEKTIHVGQSVCLTRHPSIKTNEIIKQNWPFNHKPFYTRITSANKIAYNFTPLMIEQCAPNNIWSCLF